MSQPRILVVDRGSFLPFAQALAADAEVLYFSEFGDMASLSRSALVGRDVPGIECVDSMWSHIDDVDMIAFPDVGDGDMQHWLREQGYVVWGSGKAEMLELDRWQFKQLLKKLGMPLVDTRHVIGLDDLEAILREEDDLYVKTSFFHGDLETYHHISWALTEPWFNDLKHRLGPHGREVELLVEAPMPGIEIGYDGYVVDGQYPKRAGWGIELKDAAYIGKASRMSDMPECLQEANAVLAEALLKLGARGNFHAELRVAEDGTAYISDPALRCGSPPFGCMSLWITNWVEIVMAGAQGEIAEPEFAAPYAAEVELTSGIDWSLMQHWLPLGIPKEIEPWVRLRRAMVQNGQWWCIPDRWLDTAGAAVGLGPTPGAAIDAALDVASQIDGYQLHYNHHCKKELLEEWDKAQSVCAGEGNERAVSRA